MKKLTNILYGGNNTDSNKKIEIFLSIIIIGYFGVKIIYGFFFKFYPQKYYFQNVQVTTNESPDVSNTETITLNAYVPGMWNNEMADFITLLVLAYVVYIYTNVSQKSIINEFGNLGIAFLVGYIIGLGYPPIYNNYKNIFELENQTSDSIKYLYLSVFIGFIVFISLLNYTAINTATGNHKINYLIYVIVILLLFFGLIFSKKNTNYYNSVTYFHNNGESCNFTKNGVVQTSGDKIKITVPFTVFIILLLFSYEPSEMSMRNLYSFIYGILLGILVSSISYYGIEYFLVKTPQRECSSVNECVLKEMPAPIVIAKDENKKKNNPPVFDVNSGNLNANLGTNTRRLPIITVAVIITIILLIIYLAYYFMTSSLLPV